MENELGVYIIRLLIRGLAAGYCIKKAQKLNRNEVGWGIFGFVFIIIPVIWMQFLKPVIDWENREKDSDS
jgi:TM2 domain-containing membrane protein YozV